jgi:hypothetical protein
MSRRYDERDYRGGGAGGYGAARDERRGGGAGGYGGGYG